MPDTSHQPPESERLWNGVLAELQLQVSKPVFITHFTHTTLLSFEQGVATIGCPNSMIMQMIESRYYSLVKSVLDHRTKTNTSVVFQVATKRVGPIPLGPLFEQDRPGGLAAESQTAARRARLGGAFTFETFAVSGTNQMAFAASTAVAKDLGRAYNPLLLYGGVGVGKTHLMQAIGHEALSKNPSNRVVFCMGDEFTNEIIAGIRNKTTQGFKQKYRSAQLLLVDDIQFIAGKQAVQEEFFHTFNAIQREGGQIVLTSDRPPGEIARLEDRLRSRFEAGLIIDVPPPDFELRAAITGIKADLFNLKLPSDIAQLIAGNITEARAIEGFLRKLKNELSTKRVALTIDLVSGLLGHRKEEKQTAKQISSEQVLETVASYYSIRKPVLKGPQRSRTIVRPRQIVMYLCKTRLGSTHDDIGSILGGRDHTTVMHGVDIITQELSTNEKLRGDVEGITKLLWG